MVKKCLVCGLVVTVLGLGALTATSHSQPPQDTTPSGYSKSSSPPSEPPLPEKAPQAAYYEPVQNIDALFARLKAIREQRDKLAKAEQQVLAQIRGKVQEQRKALVEIEKRLRQFESELAQPILPPGAVPPPGAPAPPPPGAVPPPPVKDASAPDGPPLPTAAPSGAVFSPWQGPFR